MEPISIVSPSTSYEPPPQTHTSAHHLLASLRSSFPSLDSLQNVLLQILITLDSVPPSHQPTSRPKLEHLRGDDILHVISTIQHIILNDILPAWFIPLRDGGHEQLVKALFCPPSTARGAHRTNLHCTIATSALTTFLSHISTLNPQDPGPAGILAFAISTLDDIVSSYPLDFVYDTLFLAEETEASADPRRDCRRAQDWEDYVRTAFSVPGRVANVVRGQKDIVCSEQLEYGTYFSNVCISTEKILFRTTQKSCTDTLLQPLNYLLLKLLNLGLFPSCPPSLPSQPSFFSSTLATVRRHLHLSHIITTTSTAASSPYSATWTAAIKSLPLISQQTFLVSFLGALDCQIGLDTSASARRNVGECAGVLRGVMGKLGQDDEELWSAVSAVICGSGRTWDIGIARSVVCWIADEQDSRIDEGALEKLLDATVALWTNPENIRHSLLSQHRYSSSLFLLILACLPSSSSTITRLALSSPFVTSVSTYLGHLDSEVRRCGMLVGEVVAKRCGKKLEFGGWEGAGEGLQWARAMGGWQADWAADGFQSVADVDVVAEKEREGEDTVPVTANSPRAQNVTAPDSDDDSLQGYDSLTSSRSASPTQSELGEIEKDPTLRVGRPKPFARPVYLTQLIGLLRAGGGDDAGAAEAMDMGLTHAEGLVRRKKGFGMELEENAVELTIVLAGLKNNFELERFDERRQGGLTALAECCPRKAAITLVEQIFTNQYSISQRFVMLTALALGARALAGLPVPPSVAEASVSFPSKMSPAGLHQRYASAEEREHAEGGEVRGLVRGITGPAMERSKEEVEEVIPEAMRERRLRLGTTRTRIAEVVDAVRARDTTPMRKTTFADVAAEYFIMPLVNHMWLHLRDVKTRTRGRTGSGTGIILGSMVLAQYLGTLAVLVHAARHAPAFLSVVAPGAVEIALALGQRGGDDTGEGELVAKEAAVLTAALEVVLVALDASVELDGGRTLGLEYTALLVGVGEWAGAVLAAVEGGQRVRGGGGAAEGRASGAAAGIVLKVEKVITRWGRSMVGLS